MESRMEESHTRGPPSHGDPESCDGARKEPGEALTGAHVDGVSSREIMCNQGANAVELCGRQHTRARESERSGDPARSKSSSTRGNSMRENREIPCPTGDDGNPAGRTRSETPWPAVPRDGKCGEDGYRTLHCQPRKVR